jgi:DNA-binding CsgD family transcriptional regulator
LDALRAAVAAATSGPATIALVEGEAGIGKSRLLAESLDFARERGFLVLVGACDEFERDRPLGAVGAALLGAGSAADLIRPEFARVFRGAMRPDAAVAVKGRVDEGWLVVETVLDVLEDLAARGPLVLAVEDLQWADPLTLRAVHSIARYLARLPLAVLATVRPGSRGREAERAVADLVAHGAEHVVLGPLSPAEAVDLAGAVAGHPPGPNLRQQVASAGGNPLFVIELVRSLDEDGTLDRTGEQAESSRASLPPTLRLTILRRVSRLPEDVLNVLRAASILGPTFSMPELALVTRRAPSELLPALVAASDAGLLVESGDALAFRHALVHDAIYHDLPLAVRKALHREAAGLLRDTSAPLDRVAAHFAVGAEVGDTEAVLWLRRTALTLTQRAPSTAVRLLERAREISDPGDAQRITLDAELVEPLRLTGRLREAESLARLVLTGGPGPAVEVLARTGLAGVLSMGGRYREAIEHLEQAAAASSGTERDSLAAIGSVFMVLAGEVGEAREAAASAVAAGERLGADQVLCAGLQALAMVALADGFVDQAVSFGERAVATARRAAAAWTNPRLWHGTALADADRLDEAGVVLGAGRSEAEETGAVARLPLYHWAIADLRLAAGEWDDAVAEAQAGLALIEESATEVGDVFAYAICAHVAFHRGDSAATHAALDAAQRSLVAGPTEIGFEWMSWIAALVHETEGRLSLALSTLAEAWDSNAPVRYLQAASRASGPDLVRLALAVGDRERAEAVTEELERSAPLSGSPTARGIALRCRGLLDRDPAALLEAVAAHRDGPRPYPLAVACEDAGVALGRVGQIGAAVPLLKDAAAVYERLGAVRDADRVQPALRQLGVRTARRPARRPAFGWGSLTPTELKVIDLVVTGLTNRQIAERLFVSRRTVATHLEHVFQKLGHANRVELAADAGRRAATEPAPRTAPRAPGSAPTSRRRPPRGHQPR